MELEISVTLRNEAAAASAARRTLRGLRSLMAAETCDEVELLVSELVTNSFRHAGLGSSGRIVVHMFATPDHVHVDVTDQGRGFDYRRRNDASPDGSGWGLFMVEEVANRWGMHSNGGTTVWFEIDAPDGKMSKGDERREAAVDTGDRRANAFDRR